jgi:hypothetical protein
MTNKQLIETANMIAYNLGDQTTKAQKKLKKIYDILKPCIDKYQAHIEDIRLDNASVDDKGNLILDEKGNYKFNKEGIKKINEGLKSLLDKEIEFKIIEVVNPDGLDQYLFLKGWVNGVNFKDEEIIDL